MVVVGQREFRFKRENPVKMSARELWTALHGMVLGAGLLLLFTGALASLWSLRSSWLTEEGAVRQIRRLRACTWAMMILVWLAVLLGTYLIYPWYRSAPPPGAILASHPKYLLLANPHTADWHEFGMEWKEHVAWLAPILATALVFVVTRWPRHVMNDRHVRWALLILLIACFFCAGIGGVLGALVDKAAPIR